MASRQFLANKNAIIYGGGSISSAVARGFAAEGARVFLAGRTLEKPVTNHVDVAIKSEAVALPPAQTGPARALPGARHHGGRHDDHTE